MFVASTVCFLVFMYVASVACRADREPECSRFHYEEQLLEKMVRMEFNVERIQQRLDSVSESCAKLDDSIRLTEEVKDQVGSVYTRWGQDTCPTGSSFIYDGFVAGSHYTHTGSGVNYLCLSKEPIWANGSPTASNVGIIHGSEYETKSANIWTNLHDNDVPCAACRSRGATMMIPGRNICYEGWKLEYYGYLMTSYQSHAGSKEFICVDSEATVAEGSNSGDQNGALLYFVKAVCGALKCPPYDGNKLITCAVCSQTK
ncbi:short-chain collagen C4-like isoform X2 [Dreissena polymorpha]|uniref:short-chain collagen C4-like isoform X2 n=1 Tax=Dreissena polymorpha TaxID=45954 RepID=UPI002263C952|nr:short-chain collagen C4-like isoform X2 [Dreissena polymorpha]